jgi:hypothetical protein
MLIPLAYGRHVLCCRWVQVPIAASVMGQGPVGTPGRGGSATVVPLAQPSESESPQAREDQQAVDQGLTVTGAGNEAQAASGTVDPQADSPRAGIELQLDVNLNDVDGVEAGLTVV